MSTLERSTTDAPYSSACWRASTGTHLPASPKTGSVVARPGTLSRFSPMASTWPGGACPRPTSTPLIRIE